MTDTASTALNPNPAGGDLAADFLTTGAIPVGGAAKLKDDPTPELRLGIGVCLLFFVGFLGWAAIAPMDQAAYATGQVSVSGRRQSVQHREGGVVGALHVQEGQKVQKGQVLIELAGSDVVALERTLASRVIGLKAQRARLLAEQTGGPIVWPVEFAGYTDANLIEAQGAIALQQSQYGARRSTLSTQGGVLGQRTAQLDEQITGLRQQIASIDEQKRLLEEELDGIRELNSRGFAPTTQIRAYERQLAELDGTRAQLQAQIASSNERIGETRLQNVQLNQSQLEQVAQEMRDVDAELNDATPRWQAAQDQLARIQIRAPATGSVVGLSVFTVGGVIAPGQKLLDIVPDAAPLVLEARVSPNDADDLRIGQETEVKFSGLRERDLPKLKGVLSRLSADSFNDEQTGAAYFTAEVTVPLSEIQAIQHVKGEGFELIPGMPVQILVPLKKRTALQYMLEPLTQAVWRSFREQ